MNFVSLSPFPAHHFSFRFDFFLSLLLLVLCIPLIRLLWFEQFLSVNLVNGQFWKYLYHNSKKYIFNEIKTTIATTLPIAHNQSLSMNLCKKNDSLNILCSKLSTCVFLLHWHWVDDWFLENLHILSALLIICVFFFNWAKKKTSSNFPVYLCIIHDSSGLTISTINFSKPHRTRRIHNFRWLFFTVKL